MKYPVCSLSHVIHPGEYCVISCNREHVLEVMELERKMEEEMVNDATSQFELSHEMCVAVKDSEGRFKRGVIERKLKQDLYEVLLVDYGKFVEVNNMQIKIITNENFVKVEPLAFKVKLYGLIPTKYVSVDGVRKPRACREWRPDSRLFVHNLFKDYHKIVVQCILIQQRVVYGDLYVQLKPEMKFVSLRKLLCKNEFCSYSECHFLEKEDISTFSEKKMKFVKKWQTDNFSLPKPDLESPKESTTKANTEGRIVSKEINETAEERTAETNLEQRGIGIGRGKIKLLIAEMNKKEVTTDTRNSCHSEVGTKQPLGRGQLLKKCIERKKFESSDIPRVGNSSSQRKSLETSPDRFRPFGTGHEYRVPDNVSMIGKAVTKSEIHFSEFSDSSDLTFEDSLSTNDEPPIIRRLNESKSDERSREIVKSISESLKVTNKSLREKGSSSQKESVQLGGSDSGGWKRSTGNNTLRNRWAPYVLFDDSVIEPVKTFTELPIRRSVIKNLERGGTFGYLSQAQRWAIPAIRKQLNTVVIGSSKTGKTLSYIVPLIDYIQDEFYFEELPEGNGPAVVIVASSSRVCESIYYMCHSLLGNHTKFERSKSKVKVLLAHGNGCEKEIWVSLTNGCDVLISTPHCLVRLLEMPILTNFERLTCLVLDEIDIITEYPFWKQTRIILEKAKFSTRDRHYQRILCGEKWTPHVETLAKTYVVSYALVIGSYSEAVIHEGLKPSIYIVDRTEKPQILLDKLKNLIGESKILVVCEWTSEAVLLYEFLVEKGIPSLLAHENIMVDKLKDLGTAWKSSKDTILIATDGVLAELDVREAETLVHFALPSKSKTNFYLRYLALKDFLRNSQKLWKVKGECPKVELNDIILIDDENHLQLPHIVDFVARLGGKVPEKILDKCQEIRRQIEVQKKNIPLCDNLLSFGRCRNQKSCPRRHALLYPVDSHGRLPTKGWINFVVLKTQNASCFAVRLVEHVDANGETHKWDDDRNLELSLKLSEFYKSEDNRRSHGTPEIGDVCAVKIDILQQEIFFRAKVIEYLVVDRYDKPLEVSVRLLDRGDIWRQKIMELYELPEELSKYPPIAIDVRIPNLQPKDFDVSWSEIANTFTDNLMTEELQEGQFWSGEIVLALDNTLYLEPIKRKQFLPHLRTHVFDLTVRDELLDKGIAVPNPHHLPSLLRLCSEGGMDVPEAEGAKTDNSNQVQPQWAFFDGDFIKVKFLAAEDTSTVFLQTAKFEKLLAELEEDCQKEGEKSRNGEGNTQKGNVTVGMFCLALFEDGKWNRGRVESETEEEFCIYFVDHGDFFSVAKGDVVPIPRTLLLKLPCQAIECRLVGIQETEECPMEVLRRLYDFSNDGDEYLYARVLKKDLKAKVTGGRKYCVDLKDESGVSLSKVLIEEEMVLAEEEEKSYLENASPEEKENLQEEELSEDYFTNFTDDLFEDEIGKEFLKEFASRFFNISEASQRMLPPVKDSATQEKEKEEGESDSSQRKTIQNVRRLLDLGKKRQKKRIGGTLEGREKVFTPQVLWCQNQMEVQLKILLGNVKDYSFQCSVNNISFRCFSEGKFYGVDLRIYGAINPEKSQITPKAFHVVILLTKLTYPTWPRLHADEGRVRWVSLDVESLEDKEGVFTDKIRTAKLELESGMVKKGFRSDRILPCSDSEDSNDLYDDSDSDDSERLD